MAFVRLVDSSGRLLVTSTGGSVVREIVGDPEPLEITVDVNLVSSWDLEIVLDVSDTDYDANPGPAGSAGGVVHGIRPTPQPLAASAPPRVLNRTAIISSPTHTVEAI